jgi:anti-anti-sigma factor
MNVADDAIARIFPFHIGVDAELRIRSLGPVLLRRLGEQARGRGLAELFEIQRPALAADFATLRARTHQLVVLAHREGPLRLRGEFVAAADGGLMFIGTPWLQALAQLSALGLELDDFASHDPSVELLVALAATQTSIADANALSQRLRSEIVQREQALAELRENIQLIEAQRREIRSLSTPLIEIWDAVVAVPIVGSIDHERSEALMHALLDTIAHRGIRDAILDVTGVVDIDTATADHFLHIIRAVRLLGTHAVISGVGPSVAQTLATLDAGLASVDTYPTLRAALVACVRRRPGSGRHSGRRGDTRGDN